jgi:electron transfer flavoprotein alpha subunit
MAIGLSGSAQHMAGVIDSDIIIAINKDRSCPIMEQADYYVVADLYDFVPALLRKLSEMRK